MSKFYKIPALLLTCLVAACGGGGGSPGTTNEPYTITLRADKTQLPLNVDESANRANIGVYAPYTTTLYVEARKGGAAIPGGDEIFGCNVSGGLSSGALYYLDGKEEHEVEIDDGSGGKIKVPGAYRSITLGSNSGGNSFHFHSGNQAGTARITCSVTNPSDARLISASVDIVVGSATGKAASIKTVAAFNTLGRQGNTNNARTTSAIEAYVLDDANQPLPAAARPNLQVAIVTGGASAGARLLSGSQGGSVIQVSTTGGVGQFALSSGAGEGTILLEMTADRFDNDVTNGIQDPIIQLFAMPVTSGSAGSEAAPLALVAATPPAGTNGLAYSYAFSVTGGVGPYTWTALGGLPEGLTLSPAGILSGTPRAPQVGTFQVAVRVTDSQGQSTTGNFPLAIAASTAADPTINPLTITNSGCGSNLCTLPVANPAAVAPAGDIHYQLAMTVTGPGTGSAVWSSVGRPSWVTLSADGTLTILWSATQAAIPPVADCRSASFTITAVRGGQTATRTVIMSVGSGAGTCAP